jgi:hypothetical protein
MSSAYHVSRLRIETLKFGLCKLREWPELPAITRRNGSARVLHDFHKTPFSASSHEPPP